jgi:hypothetical protein
VARNSEQSGQIRPTCLRPFVISLGTPTRVALPECSTQTKIGCPPGSPRAIHRHNANAFVYKLESSIVLQVRGGKQVTLTPGGCLGATSVISRARTQSSDGKGTETGPKYSRVARRKALKDRCLR